MDKIFISALKLEAMVGIYPEEQFILQPIMLDIELLTNTRLAAATDDIADTIDYAELVEKLQEWVAKQQFQLLESLANKLAEQILQNFLKVQSVHLRVHKFPAGLPVAGVSIAITRSRV